MFAVPKESLILTKMHCDKKIRIDLISLKNKQVSYRHGINALIFKGGLFRFGAS